MFNHSIWFITLETSLHDHEATGGTARSSLPLEVHFCYRLPLYVSLHCMTSFAWPISLHVDNSASWRPLSRAIWRRNGELYAQIRIAQLRCISVFFTFSCYFYCLCSSKDWNGNYSIPVVPGKYAVTPEAPWRCVWNRHSSWMGLIGKVKRCIPCVYVCPS
jgi:hypothetical protein